ncbi:hypothetical protein BSZ39_10030 [Bowdeniella nasicola]|uniref:Uncharacterized protein n=1 Tax=Bowdeniella nasicola TaxID=208480 RepID=A0A1Q5Q0T5_9ACTO|nr:hypothetical protein BSZ39_10030 [Bowdeniella nasicola]
MLAIVAGILAGTVLRESDTVSVMAPAGSETAVIAGPGVISQVNDEVKITAKADGAPVFLALAPMSDIEAFVEGSAYRKIEGLLDWENLKVTPVAATDAEVTLPNPAGADLFLDKRSGEGEVSWAVTDPDHQLGFIAMSDGEKPAPALTLTWSKDSKAPAMWPLIISGIVLLALAAIAALWARSANRPRSVASGKGNTEVIYVPALSAEEAEGLTRREIRDREREREREALAEARRSGLRNVSVVTSHEIPVIDEPLLEQDIERLTGSGMAAGSMIVPAAPTAEQIRAEGADDAFDEANKWAPKNAASISPADDLWPETDTSEAESDAESKGMPVVAEDDALWPETSEEDWRDQWDFPAPKKGDDA